MATDNFPVCKLEGANRPAANSMLRRMTEMHSREFPYPAKVTVWTSSTVQAPPTSTRAVEADQRYFGNRHPSTMFPCSPELETT